MASSNISEKAKLQQELQFYTNLVSNHVKRLETSKAPAIKKNVRIKPFEKSGNSSKSLKADVYPKKSVVSHPNECQRPVIQSNKLKSSLRLTPPLLPTTSVKSSLTNLNRNLPTVTTYKKINNNLPTVSHNTEQVVNKAANPSRSVLLPQRTLKSGIDSKVSKPFTAASNRSVDLQKALTVTKEVLMKMGSTKHINELNKLTAQLEKRMKIDSALKSSNSLNKMSENSSNISNNTKSSDLRPTVSCNNMSKMDSLKCRVENIAKILATTSNNSSMKVPNKSASSILCPTKSVVNSSNIITKKLCSVMQNTKVGNPSLFSSSRISQPDKSCAAKLVTSTKCLQSSQTTTPVRKEISLPKPSNMKSSFNLSQAADIKTVKRQSIPRRNSPCPSSSKPNVHKLVRSSKSLQTCLLTPLDKRLRLQKLSSMKKQGIKTKIIASKYKVVNKNLSNSMIMSRQSRFSKQKGTSSPSSFNKGFQSVRNAHCTVKKFNSKHKLVNILKSPKKFNNTLLKTSTPRMMQTKSASKNRRLSASGFTPSQKRPFQKSFGIKPVLQPKLISRGLPKTVLNKKSGNHMSMSSKFKVVNGPGSPKKLSKSPKVKHDVIRRTKSGVDMDLLLELAAEKELLEKENGRKTIKKRAVLLKRVYKTKSAIVNKNMSSFSGTKVAKMIKAKYSFNKRNTWQKQLVTKRFSTFTHHTGHHYKVNFKRTPVKRFYNARIKRHYFTPVSQNQHKIKNLRHHKGSLHFNNKSYHKSFNQHSYIRNEAKCTPISKLLASRVLHRSINRVLNASVKKELKKSSKVNSYCMFYNRFGRCNKGLKCAYVHDPSKIAVCTRFLRGTCKNEKCLFSHVINPGKMAICSFFLLDSCTKTDCPYRHETLSADAQLCKAFVQGYCPDGKQCKKAHVLVCPKYIQGLCDKGDACAFPHPPPKEKKNFLKPVEKNETPVEAEDFMERVSRYFQPVTGQDTRTFETTVVPKRQIIPEQPSFIAL